MIACGIEMQAEHVQDDEKGSSRKFHTSAAAGDGTAGLIKNEKLYSKFHANNQQPTTNNQHEVPYKA